MYNNIMYIFVYGNVNKHALHKNAYMRMKNWKFEYLLKLKLIFDISENNYKTNNII